MQKPPPPPAGPPVRIINEWTGKTRPAEDARKYTQSDVERFGKLVADAREARLAADSRQQGALSDEHRIWPLVEKYADAVSLYNEAVRIDVGITKVGNACLSVEKELRALLEAALLSRASSPRAEAQAVLSNDFARNTLNSIANWFESRSETVWAKEFSHAGLMLTWANDLRAILAAAKEPTQ